MNSKKYGISEEIYDLDGDRRVSYGIAVYSDYESDGTSCIIESVRDISPDKNKVENLVELFNKYELSLLHLDDVLEDFLEC